MGGTVGPAATVAWIPGPRKHGRAASVVMSEPVRLWTPCCRLRGHNRNSRPRAGVGRHHSLSSGSARACHGWVGSHEGGPSAAGLGTPETAERLCCHRASGGSPGDRLSRWVWTHQLRAGEVRDTPIPMGGPLAGLCCMARWRVQCPCHRCSHFCCCSSTASDWLTLRGTPESNTVLIKSIQANER